MPTHAHAHAHDKGLSPPTPTPPPFPPSSCVPPAPTHAWRRCWQPMLACWTRSQQSHWLASGQVLPAPRKSSAVGLMCTPCPHPFSTPTSSGGLLWSCAGSCTLHWQRPVTWRSQPTHGSTHACWRWAGLPSQCCAVLPLTVCTLRHTHGVVESLTHSLCTCFRPGFVTGLPERCCSTPASS